MNKTNRSGHTEALAEERRISGAFFVYRDGGDADLRHIPNAVKLTESPGAAAFTVERARLYEMPASLI